MAYIPGTEDIDVLFGTDGDDQIFGFGGNDALIGFYGNDLLDGGNGDDQLDGGIGDDELWGDSGVDTLVGGTGQDRLRGNGDGGKLSGGDGFDTVTYLQSGAMTVNLTEGTATQDGLTTHDRLASIEAVDGSIFFGDSITGNNGYNQLRGYGGNDLLYGLGGADLLDGGFGEDQLWGGDGEDTLIGGDSDDMLFGDAGADTLSGGDGSDELNGGTGNDILEGGLGSDRLDGGSGVDTISYAHASTHIDVNLSIGVGGDSEAVYIDSIFGVENVDGSGLNDLLVGNEKANVLRGIGGNDRLVGDLGNDTLDGGSGRDRLYGDTGNDVLDGGAEGDKLYGGAGDDTYVIDSIDDRIDESVLDSQGIPSDGIDTVRSSYSVSLANATIFKGGIENLTLAGIGNLNGSGNELANVLTGNTGANRLDGGEGGDTLAGGFGNDMLVGGEDSDTFLFNTTLNANSNVDAIADFSVPVDTIALENAVFTALTAIGALAAEAFNIGSAAQDADDRVVYDPATGALMYDSNGNADGGAIQFVTLDAGLSLTYDDFLVI
jgi:serralysin